MTAGHSENSTGQLEYTDLAATHPEKVKELRDRLNVFLQDAVKPGNPERANLSKAMSRKKKAAK